MAVYHYSTGDLWFRYMLEQGLLDYKNLNSNKLYDIKYNNQ